MPTKCLLLELPMQLDGAASLELNDSGATHCFVQQSEIPNSCAIFKGNELKVQPTMGHKFHTKINIYCQLYLLVV